MSTQTHLNLQVIKKLFDRPLEAHKYDFGHVLVIGGSPGMVGAPFLSAMAALRVGAGLVTIASAPDVIDKLEKRVEEIMTLRLPAEISDAVTILRNFIAERKVTTVVIGPGLAASRTELALTLLPHLSLPVVVDGGALGALAGHLTQLREYAAKNPQIILTPHTGEYHRLTGLQIPTPSTNPEAVANFARDHHLTVVLKGHHTLVAHPDGQIWQSHSGNPGQATAGSGDVLAGVIAGLLAQKLTVADATETGVYLHGVAGDAAAQAKTQLGLIASDVVEFLPAALKILQKQADPK